MREIALPKVPEGEFHKKALDPSVANYCLGTEKLGIIKRHMENDPNIDREKDTVLLPFGGPGALSAYLGFYGWRSLAGDILYDTYAPEDLIKEFNYRMRTLIVQPSFQYWDATNLPLENNTQSVAIVNPPYGMACDVEGDPLKLCKSSSDEVNRVLRKDGVAYYVFPQAWEEQFMDEMHARDTKQPLNDISSRDSQNPLSLIRVVKS